MYLIVGLGNPENDYRHTRHNMGFNTINQLAKQYKIEVIKKKFKGLYGKGIVEGEEVILLKPQTFMNLSGESIREVMQFYRLHIDQLIVIYDDIDIQPGKIKIRKAGGAGTHNGMKSVLQAVKTENIKRIRVGIGMPKEKVDLVNNLSIEIFPLVIRKDNKDDRDYHTKRKSRKKNSFSRKWKTCRVL